MAAIQSKMKRDLQDQIKRATGDDEDFDWCGTEADEAVNDSATKLVNAKATSDGEPKIELEISSNQKVQQSKNKGVHDQN